MLGIRDKIKKSGAEPHGEKFGVDFFGVSSLFFSDC